MPDPIDRLAPQIDRWTGLLLEQGWCVIPSLLPPQLVAELDCDLASDFHGTPFCEGGFYGRRTKRFGRLLARSPLAARLVQHPLVVGISERVLEPWCDTIQLNLTQALALHPGAPPQLPHRDQDMWRGAIVSYCLGWLKPYENQWLAYPPHVARTFSPELAALVGYQQHRPNLGNYEGQCPSVLLKDETPGRLAAIDALRPDQEELIAEFVRNQDWPAHAAAA